MRSWAYVDALRKRARMLNLELVLEHPIDALWPFVSNTDMVNREMKLPSLKIASRPTGKGGSELSVQSQDRGMPLRYEELPYEWQSPSGFKVERIFSQGPVAYLCFETRLEPLADGRTRVCLGLAVVPKLPWFLLKSRVQQILERMRGVYAKIDKRAGHQSRLAVGAFLADPARFRPQIDALEQQWRSLASDAAMAARLAEYIHTAPDPYVKKLRPFELADFYQLDPMDTLCFLLKATKAGFLNLSWDLICPGCQGAKVETASLSRVNPEAHCDVCDIDYSISFDENFELSFYPVATVRKVDEAPFCAGSPSNTTHLVLQKNIWPDQRESFSLNLATGSYRFRSPTIAKALHFEVAQGGLAALELEMDDEFMPVGADEQGLQLAPGCRVIVHNRRALFQTLSLENMAWRSRRVTAALVSTLQDFRDSFSSEVLRPGLSLAISNLTVMFTDLKDSTLIYDVRGDAYAFRLVQEHFEIMQELIRIHHGAIVKTIGDAVMAVFQDPLAATRCALEIQRRFRAWNHQWHAEDPAHRITVKLGLHRGPSIALTLNDRLDYFGTTINRAARIQSESVGEDIVFSSEMLETEGVSQLLAPYRLEGFDKNLKGLSGLHRLYRLDMRQPPPDADVPAAKLSIPEPNSAK